jgi:phosphate starvation-inducible PhoH-like protein
MFQEVAGELGRNLKVISDAYRVTIDNRGGEVTVIGDGRSCEAAVATLEAVYALVESGHALGADDVRHAVSILRSDPQASLASYFEDTVLIGYQGKRITPRTVGQKAYIDLLREKDIVFGAGPAGTGKTYLAMAVAVAALKRGEVKRIILTRPAVEAGEKLGFLPGDLNEKVDPYLRPLYDALEDMMSRDQIARSLEARIIEVAPLAFMRGRTLESAYVVLDEAQNTTVEQMRMFLTRLGNHSKMVVTGDVTQVDLPPHRQSGMAHALKVLGGVTQIGVAELSVLDVVRHPAVAAIITAYEYDDSRRARLRKREGNE